MIDADLGLRFGSLDLLGRDKSGLFWFEVIAEGTAWGNPEALVSAIESFLQDGAIESTESYGNREISITVAVCGATAAGLAAGEAALMAEVGRRNTLTYTPADDIGPGPVCVFDVVNSSLDHSVDDVREINGRERNYTLTMRALPFTRTALPQTSTTTAPTVTTPTVTSIDTGDSTTGWSSPDGAVTSSGGGVRVSYDNNTTNQVTRTLKLIRSGLSVAMSGTPFVKLTSVSAVDSVGRLPTEVKLNGVVAERVSSSGYDAWYRFPGSTLNTIEATFTSTGIAPGQRFYAVAYDVSRSNSSSNISGARQTFRSVAVTGAARAQGNLLLADQSNTSLGSVLIYTSPGDVLLTQPPLRNRLTSGNSSTADTALVSGASSDLATQHTFDIPSAEVPYGTYSLMARVKSGTSTSDYTATWVATSTTGEGANSGTRVISVGTAWKVVEIARMILPVRKVGPSVLARVQLTVPGGVTLDEAWLFNLDVGQLTWIENAKSKVWIDAPTLDQPMPSVTHGTAADRSNEGTPTLLYAFGRHEFEPPSVNAFVVNSGSVATDVTYTYYPRYHTHVS